MGMDCFVANTRLVHEGNLIFFIAYNAIGGVNNAGKSAISARRKSVPGERASPEQLSRAESQISAEKRRLMLRCYEANCRNLPDRTDPDDKKSPMRERGQEPYCLLTSAQT